MAQKAVAAVLVIRLDSERRKQFPDGADNAVRRHVFNLAGTHIHNAVGIFLVNAGNNPALFIAEGSRHLVSVMERMLCRRDRKHRSVISDQPLRLSLLEFQLSFVLRSDIIAAAAFSERAAGRQTVT
jgi:hypothetical protein